MFLMTSRPYLREKMVLQGKQEDLMLVMPHHGNPDIVQSMGIERATRVFDPKLNSHPHST